MKRASARESELYIYWLASSEAHATRRAAAAAPSGLCTSSGFLYDCPVADSIDELEVLAESTDWPLLRDQCRRSALALQPKKMAVAK